MKKTAPHYLLFTEAKSSSHHNGVGNRWRFVLEEIGTTNRFEEADEEPGIQGERLQLLAAVRGLEALEQPSRVTLITPSKHVGRGIRRHLTQWKENNWQWERFEEMTPVKDHDLWKRIDRAMQIHRINCRIWQFDPPHVRTQTPKASDQAELVESDSYANSEFEPKRIRLDQPASEIVGPVNTRGNRIVLDKSKTAFAETLDHCSRIDNALEKKIRPLGQGKAYGYAVN